MEAVVRNIASLGKLRLAALGGVGLAVLAAVAAMAMLMSQPMMGLLYSGLDRTEAGRMARALEEMGIGFDLSADGRSILVAQAETARARMALAERGLPSAGGDGYELFDDQGSLGLTSFMQKVTRLRALEGELARTIQSLNGVMAARVHLVLPDREAFSRTAPKPTASVVVRMAGDRHMPREQASAIRHLVAAAVPSMTAEAVTVLDSAGRVLASEGDAGSASAARAEDLRHTTESRLAATIKEMMAPLLGMENFRVTVSADHSLDREVLSEQTFDPESQVERSTRSMTEREQSSDTALEAPTTVDQNLPESEVQNGPGTTTSARTDRAESTVNFEISSVRRERVREPGELKRLSVAILVNSVARHAPDGSVSHVPRPQEELDRIANLVRGAVGFSEARGDTVTVESMQFLDAAEILPEMSQPTITDILGQNVLTLLQWGVLLVVTVLLIWFGLRPLVERLLPARRAVPAAAQQALPLAAASPGAEAAAAAALSGPAQLALGQDGTEQQQARRQITGIDKVVDQMIEMRTVEGKVRASSVNKLGEIVEEFPDEAVSILRAWIYEEAV